MIELFDSEWIIARLKADVATLKIVSGAADLAKAEADLKQTPSAFVIELSDRASENRTGTMTVSQNNTARFAVITATKNLRDFRGQHAKTDLRTIRADIIEALHGWQPNTEFGPIEKRDGRLMKMTNAVLWWQDEFVTAHLLRSV